MGGNNLNTRLTELLGIRYPIIQAGMAGGPTTPELVAAVSNAGGLGTLGAGYLKPSVLRDAIQKIKQLTDKPFGVNLFIPETPAVDEQLVDGMMHALRSIRTDLGIEGDFNLPTRFAESFDEQLAVILDERVPIFSCTFGVPEPRVTEALQSIGALVVGTATTVEEAKRLEAAGVDAVVAQGSEAGGHRGTFLGEARQALVGTMALVPQIVDNVKVPVIASGGIMDGRGLVAALALGASGVQLGTAYLSSAESGAHPAYKARILTSDETKTDITTSYSGRAARGIRTKFMERLGSYSGPIPPYPIQNALTREIRNAAAAKNNTEYMSLWAGQGLRLAQSTGAAELTQRIVEEATAVLQSISRNTP